MTDWRDQLVRCGACNALVNRDVDWVTVRYDGTSDIAHVTSPIEKGKCPVCRAALPKGDGA